MTSVDVPLTLTDFYFKHKTEINKNEALQNLQTQIGED